MPTYEYACKSCGEHLEIVQSFKDDPLTTCPSCDGPLRKVFGAIGIAFKGSGFYKTDNRGSAKSGAPAKSEPSTSTGTSESSSVSSGASSGSGGDSSGSGGDSKSTAAS